MDHILLAELNQIVETIKSEVQPEEIYLFGSHAFGSPNSESDFDFYIVLTDEGLRPMEAAQKIYKALSNFKLEYPVDILTSRKAEFLQLCQLPTLERKIKREGELLYGSQRLDS
jgi:predicted nucleotidyltransferase